MPLTVESNFFNTFMKVHVPIDIRDGTEVFLTVEAAKCSSSISKNHRTTCILSLDWSPHNVQPKLYNI